MKVAVIGGVSSTAVLIDKLKEHYWVDVHVFGFEPPDARLVSGWANLGVIATKYGYKYNSFVRVDECQKALECFAPDWIFAVGLSQLIPSKMLNVSSRGCIGFHPTALPFGRGRAPLAWLVLEQQDGAATFFLMGEGVDDGPILAQAPFVLAIEDDASSVEEKLLLAEAHALDELLPNIKNDKLTQRSQDHQKASYYGRRSHEDGWLDWAWSAEKLLRLIKASTIPHPGAYTFQGPVKLRILKASVVNNPVELGVVGRILKCLNDGSFVVQCGVGHLHITNWDCRVDWVPRVGQKLGFYVELEVHLLQKRVENLERRLVVLEGLLAEKKDH
jgi:methionyl-tRNA formyltransferase